MKWNNKKFKTADELTAFLNDKMDELSIDFRMIHISEMGTLYSASYTLFYFGEPSKD